MTGMEQDRLRAAMGPQADRYLAQFERIERSGKRWAATWNWPAFFASSGWFAYRRMGRLSLLNFFLPALFIAPMLASEEKEIRLGLAVAYLIVAFAVIPIYANALYYRHLKARESPRPPSWLTGIEAALTAALALVVPAMLVAVPAAYSDYTPRATVSEGLSRAAALKREIGEFYEEHKRLPAPQEAEKFRADGGKYTRSVVYDAEQRMIVVTLGDKTSSALRGRRIALPVEEKSGTLDWRCRAIDLEQKYLPADCRDQPPR